MNVKAAIIIAASALLALAAWPLFVRAHSVPPAGPAPGVTPAPVLADYLERGRVVSFYEAAVQRHPDDQILAQMLASQYLLRFRETGDVADLLRAERQARRSLAIQPHYNFAAESALASALLALHQFHEALAHAANVARMQPWSAPAAANKATLLMEIGDYADAEKVLKRAPGSREDPSWDTATARYDELTGNLDAARQLIERAGAQVDSIIDSPAEARAWYHFRTGELAWEQGDPESAEAKFKEALAIFPRYARAYNGLAKLYWGQKRWHETLDAAMHGADLIPLPETLGYKADAQRALGDASGYRLSTELIEAIERLGNVKGINDRLIATFYVEHGIRLADALAIAERDLRNRDDVFSEDTLAWALATNGRWSEARVHAQRAVSRGTQDSRLQFHAGLIALHTGHADEARRRLQIALSLNPHFHPLYADEARRALLSQGAPEK